MDFNRSGDKNEYGIVVVISVYSVKNVSCNDEDRVGNNDERIGDDIY